MKQSLIAALACTLLLSACQRDTGTTPPPAPETVECEADETLWYTVPIVLPERAHEVQQFFGYYFYAYSPTDILILRLAQDEDEHLFIQEMLINYGELQEGPITVLGNVSEEIESSYGATLITFREAGGGRWSIPRVGFRPEPPAINVHLRGGRRITSSWSFFVQNRQDVVSTFNAVFSREGQKRFAGVFAFYRYEIVNLGNAPHPIPANIANDRITVVMSDNGFLTASREGGVNVGLWGSHGQLSAFFFDGTKPTIWWSVADGHSSGGVFSLVYEDVDTIVYRHNSWVSNDAPAFLDEPIRIEFRLIYRRAMPLAAGEG